MKGQIVFTGWDHEGTDCFHRMGTGRDRMFSKDGIKTRQIVFTGWDQGGTDCFRRMGSGRDILF